MVRLPWGSRSTASTVYPCSLSATPRFSVVVVFATPPFWLANAITLVTCFPLLDEARVFGRGSRRDSPMDPLFRARIAESCRCADDGEGPGYRVAPTGSEGRRWLCIQTSPGGVRTV